MKEYQTTGVHISEIVAANEAANPGAYAAAIAAYGYAAIEDYCSWILNTSDNPDNALSCIAGMPDAYICPVYQWKHWVAPALAETYGIDIDDVDAECEADYSGNHVYTAGVAECIFQDAKINPDEARW